MNIKIPSIKLGLLCLIFVLTACDSSNEEAKTSTESQPIAPVEQVAVVLAEPVIEPVIETEEQRIQRAMEIHKRVITIDTHNDFSNANFTEDLNYTMDTKSQVNLPKMKEGGLDVSWLVVFTGQGDLNQEGYAKAYDSAMKKFDAIHWFTKEKAPAQIGLALTSNDVRRLDAEGKKVAMIAVENAYPLGVDLNNIKKFADLGARYISLAHNGHSQFADSNTGERTDPETGEPTEPWLYNGLSELGKKAIPLINKYGIMLDLSHPSKQSNLQTMALSKAPVIASHSSARALSQEVSRNLSDEELLAVKKNGGVVQTVAFSSYLNKDKNQAYRDALLKLHTEIATRLGFEVKGRRELSQMGKLDRAMYDNKWEILKVEAEPRLEQEVYAVAPPVNVKDFIDHIDYLVKLIGIDHVGISSDFDGGGGVSGWNSAAETQNVTIELVHRGYTEEQIAQLWGGNLLRVLDEVQEVARKLQAEET